MKNVGADAAHHPWAQLTCEDPLVEILQDSTPYNPADSSKIILNQNYFTVSVDTAAPHGHPVKFKLNAFANDSLNWLNSFYITVNAPQIDILDYDIIVLGGDGDEVFDPGESAKVIPSLINQGGTNAENTLGSLITADQYTSIQDSYSDFGLIFADGGTVNNQNDPFLIKALPETPLGYQIPFELKIEEQNGYTTQLSFEIIVGFPEILLWDKDRNQNSGPVMHHLLRDSLNKSVDYITDGLPTADLEFYQAIFVFLGVSPDSYQLPEEEAVQLVNFLNQGGRIYMEGGETWYYDSPTSLHVYFNINGVGDGGGDTQQIQGYPGSYAAGLHYSYNGDNKWMDRLSPEFPAMTVFTNQEPAYVNTVAHAADGYKTIGASFEFGGLVDGGDSSNKTFLLKKMLEFFEIGAHAQGLCADFLKGNPDNNLDINVLDVVKTVQGILGTATLDTCQKWATDLNEDSTVSILDIVPLVEMILNLNSRKLTKRNDCPATAVELIQKDNIITLDMDGNMAAFNMVLKKTQEKPLKLTPLQGLNTMEWMTAETDDGIKLVAYSSHGNRLAELCDLLVTNQPVEIGEAVFANSLGNGVTVTENLQADDFSLANNFPNPFNPVTTIPFSITSRGRVTLSVYNLNSQLITQLVDRELTAGYHSIRWEAGHHSSGIYFYVLKKETEILKRKMILLK